MNIPEKRTFHMEHSTATPVFATASALPGKFIRKAPHRLKFNNSAKTRFHRLPFVASWRARDPAHDWCVPATGDYFGGYQTGEAMAHAFLKYLRDDGKDVLQAGHLTDIVESFMVRFDQEGGQAMRSRKSDARTASFNSFRGQYIGFMNTVSMWLLAATKHLGASLDQMDEKELLQKANDGLGFDEAAYMATLID